MTDRRHLHLIAAPENVAVLPPPDHLQGRAREVWLANAPIFAATGRLEPLYSIGFGALCKTVDRYLSAVERGNELEAADWSRSLSIWCAEFMTTPRSIRTQSAVADDEIHREPDSSPKGA